MKTSPHWVLLAMATAAVDPAVSAQAVRPAAAQAAADEAVLLKEFVVNPEADTAYLSKRTTAATKTNDAIRDTPATITVLSRALLDDLQPATTNDALRFAPGVNTNRPATFGAQVEIRGFLVNAVLIDGHTEDVNQLADFFHVERVEIFNGPASILYGNVGTFGGTINRVTKKPLFAPRAEIVADVGTNRQWRVGVDATGPLGKSKTFAYRFIAARRSMDFDEDFAHYDGTLLRGSLSWRPGASFFSTASFGYSTYEYVTNARYVWYDFQRNQILTPAKGFNIVEDKRLFPVDQYQGLWDTYVRLSPSIVLRNSAFTNVNFRSPWAGYGFVAQLNTNRRTINRTDSVAEQIVYSFDDVLDATIDYQLAGTKQKFIATAQWSTGVNDNYSKAYANPPAIDILAPVYGAGPARSLATRIQNQTQDQHTRGDTLGLSAMQVSKFFEDRLTLNAGLRFDRVGQRVRSTANRAAVRIVPQFFNLPWNWLPRVGALFAVTRDVNLYYSYSESFIPQFSRQPDNAYFDPQLGKQHEFGAKAEFLNGGLLLNASLFELNQRNVYVNDPDPVRANQGYRVKGSEITNQGAEFSFQASPAATWQVFGSYTYIDARNTRDLLTPANVGKRSQQIPRHQASLFGKYTLTGGPLAGLSFGGGVKYRGGTSEPRTFARAIAAGTRKDDESPSYALVDFFASYRVGKNWSANLNVTNVLDRTHYPLWNTDRVDLGDARAWKLSTRYQF